MRTAHNLMLGLILLCSTTPARAVEQVTLSEALAATLRERPMVQASAANVAAAEAAAQVRSSRYLPRLSLSERFVRTDEPGGSLFTSLNQKRFELSPDASSYNDPPARSNFETRLTLSQPLFDPDLKFDKERAALNRDAASALHGRHREEAVLATLMAYLAVQQGHARQGWAEQSLAEAEELVTMAQEREAAGTGLHADTLRSEVLRNDVRRQLLVARNSVQSAQRRLALAIGRPDGMIDIAAPAPNNAIPLPDENAAMQRGDLAAMAKTVAGAELATRQKQATYLPRIGLQASYFWNERDLTFTDEAESWSVSAGLEWLLFDAGERSSALAGARARQLALELQEREQHRQARLAVAEAIQQTEEAVAQLELAQSSLASAEASRELVSQRYAAGLATISDLLAVQTELARVRSELASAETGLIAARAQIYYEQGTLLQALRPESEARP
jgi:outer membrane protein TolC